jgi:hypothetical protein
MDCEPITHMERLDHFIKLLRRAADRFDWSIDGFGQIRAAHIETTLKLCPITALAFAEGVEPTQLVDVHCLAEAIGLGDIAIEIVEAADLTGALSGGFRAGMGLRVRMMRAIELIG